MNYKTANYVALSGGIGGAKLALGLSRLLRPDQLTIIANTGDDFRHFGLCISPDIDTLIYTVAGINNKDLGWGRQDETWNFMDACDAIGLDTWFRLGDKDLAIHIFRTERLKQGATLSEVTRELCVRFSVQTGIVPMSDDRVRTVVDTDMGELSFQEYFVKYRCSPAVAGIRFDGIEKAKPSSSVANKINDRDMQAIIVCPSNPFLSIQPILSLPGLKQQIRLSSKPLVVVSPIVQGRAIKGPTAKMMKEMNLGCDVTTVADLYADIADGIVIDTTDAGHADKIESKGMRVHVTDIVMNSLPDKIDLAREVVRFARTLSGE